MTKKEIEKLDKLISQLDEVAGKLLVPAMKDPLVKEAMKQVSNVSFELSRMLF